MHAFSIVWSACNVYPSHFFSKITDLKCVFISFQTVPSTIMKIMKVLGSSEYYCNENFKLY